MASMTLTINELKDGETLEVRVIRAPQDDPPDSDHPLPATANRDSDPQAPSTASGAGFASDGNGPAGDSSNDPNADYLPQPGQVQAEVSSGAMPEGGGLSDEPFPLRGTEDAGFDYVAADFEGDGQMIS